MTGEGMDEPTPPATILVIEDDSAARDRIEAVLVGGGHRVLRAPNGIWGLSIAIQNDIDLVCLDLRMPNFDGEEVCRALRAHPRTQDLPILVVTQVEPDQAAHLAASMGASGYVPKDRVTDELLDRIRSLLG